MNLNSPHLMAVPNGTTHTPLIHVIVWIFMTVF